MKSRHYHIRTGIPKVRILDCDDIEYINRIGGLKAEYVDDNGIETFYVAIIGGWVIAKEILRFETDAQYNVDYD